MILSIVSWSIVLVPTLAILTSMFISSFKSGIAVQGLRTLFHLIAVAAAFFIARALAPVVSQTLIGSDFILSLLHKAVNWKDCRCIQYWYSFVLFDWIIRYR